MVRQECMPPQQISPSATMNSPWSAAMSPASRKVSAMRAELALGSLSQASTEVDESMRMPPVGRMPSSRIWRPISEALRTWVRNCSRSSGEPMAEPPPAPAQIGATKEPTSRP